MIGAVPAIGAPVCAAAANSPTACAVSGAAGVCVLVFAVVFIASRYVSLSSLSAAVAFPLAVALIWHEPSRIKVGFAIVLCIIVFYTHRENIGRLLRGQENRLDLAGRSGGKR